MKEMAGWLAANLIRAVGKFAFGALVGLLGGLAAPQVFEATSQALFGKVLPSWQLGAMLGFVSQFVQLSRGKR